MKAYEPPRFSSKPSPRFSSKPSPRFSSKPSPRFSSKPSPLFSSKPSHIIDELFVLILVVGTIILVSKLHDKKQNNMELVTDVERYLKVMRLQKLVKPEDEAEIRRLEMQWNNTNYRHDIIPKLTSSP